MADIAWSDVTALPGAAGLASVGPITQAVVLVWANTQLDADMFDGETGTMTKMARSLIAAHMAQAGISTTLDDGDDGDGGGSSVAGVITAESEGDLSITYGSASGTVADMPIGGLPENAAYWSRTEFGRAYWQLLQGSLARLPMVL